MTHAYNTAVLPPEPEEQLILAFGEKGSAAKV